MDLAAENERLRARVRELERQLREARHLGRGFVLDVIPEIEEQVGVFGDRILSEFIPSDMIWSLRAKLRRAGRELLSDLERLS